MRTLLVRYDCDFAPRKLISIVVRKSLLDRYYIDGTKKKGHGIFMILEYIFQNIFSKSNVL